METLLSAPRRSDSASTIGGTATVEAVRWQWLGAVFRMQMMNWCRRSCTRSAAAEPAAAGQNRRAAVAVAYLAK